MPRHRAAAQRNCARSPILETTPRRCCPEVHRRPRHSSRYSSSTSCTLTRFAFSLMRFRVAKRCGGRGCARDKSLALSRRHRSRRRSRPSNDGSFNRPRSTAGKRCAHCAATRFFSDASPPTFATARQRSQAGGERINLFRQLGTSHFDCQWSSVSRGRVAGNWHQD